MIRVMIVEDEVPAAQRLLDFLKEEPDLEVIGRADSGEEAVEQIERLKPDLLLLDIHLPDMSGIDLLRLLKTPPAVVFTTAYDQYAIQAFELQAVDYLLKPFSRERFRQALEKVRQRLGSASGKMADWRQLQELIRQWRPQQHYLRRIPSRVGDRIYILPDNDIVYFATRNKLVFAHLKDRKYLINYTLEELESRLDPEKFFRIHRSTIVNLDYVKSIETWFSGNYKMTMKDAGNSELTISRSAARLLRKKLGW